MSYTGDTKLGILLDDEKAKAILEKYFPGISSNSQITWCLNEPLIHVAKYPIPLAFGYPVEGIGPQKLQWLLEELAKI